VGRRDGYMLCGAAAVAWDGVMATCCVGRRDGYMLCGAAAAAVAVAVAVAVAWDGVMATCCAVSEWGE